MKFLTCERCNRVWACLSRDQKVRQCSYCVLTHTPACTFFSKKEQQPDPKQYHKRTCPPCTVALILEDEINETCETSG